MHKLALLAATALLAVPATAMAQSSDSTSSARNDAVKQCRSERKADAKAFAEAYGTNKNRKNAFGKCVSRRARANTAVEQKSRSNAAKDCKAERTQDPAAFKKTYGTNKNGSNAFGKCVSSKAKAQAKAAESAQVKAEKNAAKACKAERKQDAAAFKKTYGTNKNGSNAFGKCVSKKAKAAEQTDSNPIS